MTSPAKYHLLQHAHNNPVEKQSDDQDRAKRPIAEKGFGNEPNAARDSQIDCQPQSSVLPSSVPPPSEHGDAISRPASLENMSRPSSPEVDEKEFQRPALRRPRWWSRLVADSWIIELVACFVSFAAIASIIGVLWGYDQKPTPPLAQGITLNVVISFLATISRTAIMLCIGTVLSQGKWLWFKKERSLIDLQNIENASRGPLGSALMLLNFRGRAVPCLAAFLTIATLGFDPFVQLLLTTEPRIVHESANDIDINSATSMTEPIYVAMENQGTLAQLAAAMLANVQQTDEATFIVYSSSAERPDATAQTLASPLKANCPSSNCVWNPYYALDICTQCRTTTEELTIKNLSPKSSDLPAMISVVQGGTVSGADRQKSNFTWEIIPKSGQKWQVASNLSAFPQGTDFGLELHASIVQKVVWPLNFASSDGSYLDTTGWTKQNFAGIGEPVAAIGFAEFSLDDKWVPALNNSLECAMTYCVREYNRSVVEGTLVSNVLSTHYGSITGVPGQSNNLSWSAKVNGASFTVPSGVRYGTGIASLTGYVLGNTTHNYLATCSAKENWNCSNKGSSNSETVEALSIEAWRGIDLTPNFTLVLENANALLNQVVQQYGDVSVIGDNAVTKSFVVVRWAYITLPTAIVFFGVVVFGLTVLESRRMQVPKWKASLLPLLFRYVRVDDSSAEGRSNAVVAGPTTAWPPHAPDGWFTGSNLVSEFQAEAEATATRLTRETSDLQTWQLVARDHTER